MHLVVLANFAIAQPLFDLVGSQAELLVAHRADAWHVAVLAALLAVGVPAVLALVVRLAARLCGEWLQVLAVALWVALVALPPLNRNLEDAHGAVILSAALVLGGLAAGLYASWGGVRRFLSYLAIAPVAFPLMFLVFSPASRLLRGAEEAPAAHPENPAPIVLLIFDSLSLPHLMDRSGAIDASLYPAFGELAATSHWFRHTTTVASATSYAVPAILTGRYPDGDRLPVVQDYPENLFTLLRESHRVEAFEAFTGLCPARHCEGTASRQVPWVHRLRGLLSDLWLLYRHMVTPADFAGSLPPIADTWKVFNAHPKRAKWLRDRERIAAEFLEAVRGADGRSFLALHTILPHLPWEYLPSGRRYGGPGSNLAIHGLDVGRWREEPWAVAHQFQRHLLQLRATDRLVGEVIGALRERGIWDEALVIVTADHGLSFHPGKVRRTLVQESAQDILPVPLFVKLPGQREARIEDVPAETIDIVPTVAEVLGVDLPWSIDGRSLLDPGLPRRTSKVAFETRNAFLSRFEWPVAEARDLHPAVARTADLFGDGSDPDAIYRVGPFPDLVGRSVEQLGLGVDDRAPVVVAAPKRYAAVDPDKGFVPARVWGTARDPNAETGPGSPWLGVAINGRIEALTQLVRDGERVLFFAMIPEASFRPGANRVEVYDLSRHVGDDRAWTRRVGAPEG